MKDESDDGEDVGDGEGVWHGREDEIEWMES